MEYGYIDYLLQQITELREDYLNKEFGEEFYRSTLDAYLDSLSNFYVMIVKTSLLA